MALAAKGQVWRMYKRYSLTPAETKIESDLRPDLTYATAA
jgi:hypothetical protein